RAPAVARGAHNRPERSSRADNRCAGRSRGDYNTGLHTNNNTHRNIADHSRREPRAKRNCNSRSRASHSIERRRLAPPAARELPSSIRSKRVVTLAWWIVHVFPELPARESARMAAKIRADGRKKS